LEGDCVGLTWPILKPGSYEPGFFCAECQLEKKTAVIATSAATKSFSDVCMIAAGLLRTDHIGSCSTPPLARNDGYTTLPTIPSPLIIIA
jgi:hypothetical protein